MGVRTKLRSAALVRQRAAHVAPGVVLIDMHLGHAKSCGLLGFANHIVLRVKTQSLETLFAKFHQHRTEFCGTQDGAEYNNLIFMAAWPGTWPCLAACLVLRLSPIKEG